MWVCINSTMSGLLMTALHTIDMYDLRGLKFRLSLVSRNAVYLYIFRVLILSPLIFRYFISTFFCKILGIFAIWTSTDPTPSVSAVYQIKYIYFYSIIRFLFSQKLYDKNISTVLLENYIHMILYNIIDSGSLGLFYSF